MEEAEGDFRLARQTVLPSTQTTTSATAASSAYPLPVDAGEITRLNAQHQAVTMLFGGLLPPDILSALTQDRARPQDEREARRVLDVGCGTGAWAIDLATELGQGVNAEILGIDINPMYSSPPPPPSPSAHPLNVHFENRDALLPFPEEWQGMWDVVHARFLITGIRDFRSLLTRLGALLKPGGWLVTVEPGLSCVSPYGPLDVVAPAIARMGELSIAAMKNVGIPTEVAQRIQSYLTADGRFDAVHSRREDLPMSPYPWVGEDDRMKQIGAAQLPNSLVLPDTIRPLLLLTGQINDAELDKLRDAFRAELLAGGKVLLPIHSVWARRASD